MDNLGWKWMEWMGKRRGGWRGGKDVNDVVLEIFQNHFSAIF